MAAVQVSDVVVPSIFTPYSQQLTAEKARLVQSGVLAVSPLLNELLGGGGQTFNMPSFLDLDASDSTGADNVSADDIADIQAAPAAAGSDFPREDAVPAKITTAAEIAVRLVRNKSWSSTGLAGELAGADPLQAIANRVAYYWTQRLQRLFIATWNGVIADNAAAPTGSDTHTQNDLIHDISGASFVDGVTNFSTEAFIDATVTMGDGMEGLTAIMVHSVVYARMQKNNLIDFIPDARGETSIPTFLGREVIVDDGMPRTGSVYDTWLFGAGAAHLGAANADVPTEVHREPLAGNGGGQEILTTRRILSIHPTGHAYIQGSIPNGGPSNANLAGAANWSRRFPERKQIQFARLVTREA
jgi:hypothetical protein